MKSSPLVRIRTLAFALSAACALYTGPLAQAQPIVNSSYPDGQLLFESTNVLTFSISPSSGTISALSVTLYDTNLDIVGSSNYLTSGSGLTVTGSNPEVVTTPITTNHFYTAVISATDPNGTSLTTNTFDTIIPSYIFEAEDYDYGGGLSIDTPQTNAYMGLYAMLGVDSYNPNGGGASYRPINDGTDTNTDLGTEVTGDFARAGYAEAGFTDYDQGWNNGGSLLWANYTHHYPAGKWNIYTRMASWAKGGKQAVMYQGGTNGTLLGQINCPDTQTPASQYQNYTWAPVTDPKNNLIEWDTDGNKQTLTVQVSAGNENVNFYFLMPINPAFQPKPYISDIIPDPTTNLFTSASSFSLTVNSPSGIQNSNIVVQNNGSTPAGLAFSGTTHAVNVSFPLAANTVNNITVNATDSAGAVGYASTVGTFPATYYTWECEDWDYNGGQFKDNPQTDGYGGLDITTDIDAFNSQAGNASYRPNTGGGNEVCGDALRAQYVTLGSNDYDLGWTSTGNWDNYTRHFPAGVYNMWLRVASPNGQADAATMSWVTAGAGTATQTYAPIGQFNAPLTGGWQTWSWTPLVDSGGNPVTVTNSGAQATIHMNEDNGGFNGNFFMLVPLGGTSPTGPTMSVGYGADHQHLVISWTPTGNNLYSSPSLGSGATWSLVGPANPATVPITGSAQFFYVGK